MKKLLIFTLTLLLNVPVLSAPLAGQTLKDLRKPSQAQKPKLAPDLEEILAQDDEDERQSLQGKTLAQVRQERRAATRQSTPSNNEDTAERQRFRNVLLPSHDVLPEEKQSFILQVDGTAPSSVLKEKVARLGGTVQQSLDGMGLVTIEAPRNVIRQLAADSSVGYISPDRSVAAQGHLETTTGTAQIRNLVSGTTLDGSGVTVAVLDSGIQAAHLLIYNYLKGTRILNTRDFTGTGFYQDHYGHGTHVASLVAGLDTVGNTAYRGIAPNINLLDMVVLDKNGRGSVSGVIAAIDYVISVKNTYNVQVMNLSLGTHAKDSYKNDPLCAAVQRAFKAGIVVVCAAGNDGKSSTGKKIYGSIHSPGIDPSVITVGASNTLGTDARSDDVVTSYSSRGPTRSYAVVNGVRKYDNLIKPDLVAPGNKLIGAMSTTNYQTNTIVSAHPTLPTGSVTALDRKTMYLSGTSMAAPVVAGAVALMLQANPKLTPSLVKAILMYSAQPLKGFNMLEQGAGELNVDGAVRLAKLVKTTLPTTNGGALLNSSLPTSQASTIAGQTCVWSQGVITNYGFISGSNLMKYWQNVYGSGQILGDATIYSNGSLSLVSGKTYSVLLFAGAYAVTGSGLILGDSTNSLFASGQILGDGIILGDGQILGDGIILGDGLILGDGTTRADTSLKPASAYLGDSTSCMKPAP